MDLKKKMFFGHYLPAIMLVTILISFIVLVTAEFDPELHELYETLPKSEFVKLFNSRGHSWTATEYGDDVQMSLGTNVNLTDITNSDLPVVTHDPMKLPKNFDSRQKWPQCETISEIYDQGVCGSCYLFGSINTASDRTCIHTGENVRLAVQQGNCIKDCVCCGGDPWKVFQFWGKEGLVSEECKGKYDILKILDGCRQKCDNSMLDYKRDKYFAEIVYGIDGGHLQAELFKQGPVQASFNVYEDFRHYKKGVYVHKYGKILGSHSVRVIGYGVEDGKDYWLVANSWGRKFGQNGLFKIKRYQPKLQIENFLISGQP